MEEQNLNMDKNKLEAFEKTVEGNELKWYLYDIINEVMEKDGVEENEYSLDREQEKKVCLLRTDENWYVRGKAHEEGKQYDDFYHAVCDFFNRFYEDEEKAETAVSCFLTRTLDLPVMMKENSLSMLKAQISKCQRQVDFLEERVKQKPGKKEEMQLTLNRIYLRGLKEKIKKVLEMHE